MNRSNNTGLALLCLVMTLGASANAATIQTDITSTELQIYCGLNECRYSIENDSISLVLFTDCYNTPTKWSEIQVIL